MPTRETTVTQKGQVTIPREIRELLRLKPRDRVRFEVTGEKVTIVPATPSLLAGFGAVTLTGVRRTGRLSGPPSKRPSQRTRLVKVSGNGSPALSVS